MLKQTLNKEISTPIAISIILILVILVGGFTWWQYGEIEKLRNELPDIELPEKKEEEIKISEKLVEDETADWKIYRNEEYGFEMKYPSEDWAIRSESDIYVIIGGFPIEAFPPHATEITIKIIEKNLDNYISDYNRENQSTCLLGPSPKTVSIEKIEDFILGGLNATKLQRCTALGLDIYFIFARKDNKSYLIDYNSKNSIHDQMLSTFKFLD